MRVKILQDAYFNDEYLKKNRIVELNIQKCPSWAECLDGKTKVNKTIFGDEEKQAKLNKLLDEAIEKDIIIDDVDNKTIDEQIAELEKLLKKGE
jgi:hypothetical protein